MQAPITHLADPITGDGGALPTAGQVWVLPRNCAISPYQLLAVFGSVAVVSLGIAGVWAALGHWVILPYAVLECLALGLAFVMYCRHAQDREQVVLQGEMVRIESSVGGVAQVQELPRHGIRVQWQEESAVGSSGLVRVRSGGQQALLGRFVDLDRRKQFVEEFRQAIVRVPAVAYDNK